MEDKKFLLDKKNKVAFQIIYDAGEARVTCEKALNLLEEFKFDEAKELMKTAKEQINVAHRAHTEILQEDIADTENSQYSMIFTHAQDTLMTINSEIILINHLIKIYEAFYKKMQKEES